MNSLVGVNLTNYFDEIFTEDLMFESKELADVITKMFNAENVRITATDIQFFVPRLTHIGISALATVFADLDMELISWCDNILVSVRLPTNKE